MNIAVQISPQAKAAYFHAYLDVAQKELFYVCGEIPCTYTRVGTLEFFYVELREEKIPALLRLSFVQGVYSITDHMLTPLTYHPELSLHEDFVFGSKYRGKTNEHLTQLLINVGLATIGSKIPQEELSILDPMCGRGTSLLWAMRYGIPSFGLEIDPRGMDDILRNLKKWCKIHRQKHSLRQGFLGVKPNKKKQGVCIDFSAGTAALRAVHGDCRHVHRIFKEKKFSLILSDIPYGVQHHSGKGTRNSLALLTESIPVWKRSLMSHGAMVISFNRNLPKRNALLDVCRTHNLRVLDFSIPHRMSESIVRDVLICQVDD